jgi:hypothetical protein
MYCSTAATLRAISAADVEFALSPAVNLAATGRAVKDRRIGLFILFPAILHYNTRLGFTFCSMFMSIDHPLQLMLVNTLRKVCSPGTWTSTSLT